MFLLHFCHQISNGASLVKLIPSLLSKPVYSKVKKCRILKTTISYFRIRRRAFPDSTDPEHRQSQHNDRALLWTSFLCPAYLYPLYNSKVQKTFCSPFGTKCWVAIWPRQICVGASVGTTVRFGFWISKTWCDAEKSNRSRKFWWGLGGYCWRWENICSLL